MSSSILLQRVAAAACVNRPVLSARRFISVGNAYKPNKPVQTAQASTSTTRPGTGSPDIIETSPTTAAEVNAPEAPNAPHEAPAFDGSFDGGATDWSKSYHGLSTQAFAKDAVDVLLAPLDPIDIEMKPGMCPINPHMYHAHVHVRWAYIPT